VLKNYTGNDSKPIIGDLIVTQYTEANAGWMAGFLSDDSRFEDIKVWPNGMYTAIDSRKCRVFTYDEEGNLLYIFGGFGSQFGMFRKPVAIDMMGDNIFILDDLRGNITIFEPTYYGNLINTATTMRHEGREADAVALWEELLRIDNNYQLAYSGIGKSMLSKGDNREAMLYLRAGNDLRYYSVAFRRYRNEVLNESLPTVLTVGFIAIFAIIALRITLKIIRKRNERGMKA
jgi:hypothetical protein